MTTRLEQYHKYKASDIFNLNATNYQTPLVQTSKRGPIERTQEKTKSNIFNTDVSNAPKVYSQIKRKANFSKFYESNIFNTKKPDKNNFTTRKTKTNTSSCFDSMQNNNQYKDDLKNYTKKHRPVLEDYNPDKYFGYDNASERYYTQVYGNKNVQIDNNKNLNSDLDKNKKLFSERKIAFKNQLNKRPININNDETKDFRKKPINWNEDNGHKYVESEGNRLNTAKINFYLTLQSSLFKDNNNDNNYTNTLNDKKENNILKTENNNNEINDIQTNIKSENIEPTNNMKENQKENDKEINENKKNDDNINENPSLKNDETANKNEEEKERNHKSEEKKDNNKSNSIMKKRLMTKNIFINKKPKEKEKQRVNIQKYKDYNEHNFTISYGTKKNDFEKYNEKDIKEIFAKRGIHVFDIKKNQFDNGVYNSIEFKVRENEGDKTLQKKVKAVQNDLFKKNYLVSIKERNNQAKKRNDFEKILMDEKKNNGGLRKLKKNKKKLLKEKII